MKRNEEERCVRQTHNVCEGSRQLEEGEKSVPILRGLLSMNRRRRNSTLHDWIGENLEKTEV